MAASPDPQRRGGISNHVLNLAEWLVRSGDVRVTLVSFGDEDSVSDSGSFLHVVLKSRPWHRHLPLIPILRLARVVAREKPDVIHVQGSSLGYMLLYAFFWAPRSVPKVVTVHGHPIEEGLVSGWLRRGSMKHRAMLWTERRIPRHFEVVVAGASRIMDDLRSRYDTYALTEIRVVLNGVDVVRFSGSNPREDIPELNLTDLPGGLTILNAKALTTFNGQETLIRALAMVRGSVRDARLLLAGDGPERERLSGLADEMNVSDGVHFLGLVPNSMMPRLMSLSDVVAIPSRRIGGIEEGSSILLLEAMASEKPVVVSDLGGLSETVVDGETGMLIPENNPSRLAEAILRLHEDRAYASSLGRHAREYVLSTRTWQIAADKYVAVYRSALSKM